MTDSHDDAIVPAKPKNKGGRPKKGPDLAQVVKDLQDQLAVMQRVALASQANSADQFEKFQRQATLAPVPAPSADLPPGSYIQVGVDSSGAAIQRKVRWTRQEIERTYPQVAMTTMRDFICYPHGIAYRVEPGVVATVPSIVKDLYDNALSIEKEQQEKYKPWTPLERATLDAQAQANPGVGQTSRLAIVGRGPIVRGAADLAGETPAQ